jgi:hypothetical protein
MITFCFVLALALFAAAIKVTCFPTRNNSALTPKGVILTQMEEPRPLPMGMKEFEEWSARIISGALIPTEDETSLKAALAAMLMALGPTEDHKPDSFFIHSLRKAAANEVAHSVFQQIKRDKEASEKEIQGVS